MISTGIPRRPPVLKTRIVEQAVLTPSTNDRTTCTAQRPTPEPAPDDDAGRPTLMLTPDVAAR
jgi:hypothetical protein